MEALLTSEGNFGDTLELFWGYFGYMRVTLGHFGITLGSLWVHFGYMKLLFQKQTFSPIDFNDLLARWGHVGVGSSR